MSINIKDVLTLSDNNKYVVVSKVLYDNKNYYYLIDLNNDANVVFCYEDGEELVELNDKELTQKLLPLFVNASKDVID